MGPVMVAPPVRDLREVSRSRTAAPGSLALTLRAGPDPRLEGAPGAAPRPFALSLAFPKPYHLGVDG